MTRKLIAVLPVAMALQVAAAETWYWSPTVVDSARRYLWNNENNWTNTAATRGFPHAGDTAVLGWGETGTGPYNACGTDASYALHEVRFEGDRTIAMNQGKVVLRGGGGGLKFMHDKSCINNWLGLWAVGDGEVPIHVDKDVDYAIQLGLQKQGDGNPTIVKTGPGRFICSNQARSLNYTIPLTLIRQGAYDITISNALNGVSFAFDGDDESQRICFCYLPSHNICPSAAHARVDPWRAGASGEHPIMV